MSSSSEPSLHAVSPSASLPHTSSSRTSTPNASPSPSSPHLNPHQSLDNNQDAPQETLTPGPYDSYIKTLMEVFPDETIQLPQLDAKSQDILYRYQSRNASILINKLEKMGAAILADSVGLGKTITAGAVISHYTSRQKTNVVIIVPASLKAQWRDDLLNIFGLQEGTDYQLLSQQDLNALQQTAQTYRSTKAAINLFVIDEAHNLRNENSERHQCILEWLQDNPDSKVLMLTATPINNSLNDLAHLIRLGLKGRLNSVPVPFRRIDKEGNTGRLETIDFFEALNRIQKSSKNPNFNWEDYKPTLISGISHYLVRSTRQGVEAEGSLVTKDGTARHFPVSNVINASYHYPAEASKSIAAKLDQATPLLNGLKVRDIDLDQITSATQRTQHPLDFAHNYRSNRPVRGVIPNLFQLITLFGFTPYRTDLYRTDYYGKSLEEIKFINSTSAMSRTINLQLAIHNIMQVTWLKRLESSVFSLQKSVQKYQTRLQHFIKLLDQGYISSFRDLDVLDDEADPDALSAIEQHKANPTIYNILQLRRDLIREQNLCKLLLECLDLLSGEQDIKVISFIKHLQHLLATKKYGQKILVFSFFADTINYLRDSINIQQPQLLKRAEFITGQSSHVETITRRFSPKSKKYRLKSHETEIDLLFATDILSEGQNLQDAAILINYDLHWNPVRMIQRNGRINRLGSNFSEVLISNMTPEDNIELYLKLVSRLESKISAIKNSVGLDQGILSNSDVSPIEFVEDMKSLYSHDNALATKTMQSLSTENDLLSWTNDHIFVLRDFLNSATPATIERIKNIPAGQWTYVSKNSTLSPQTILSLQKTTGHTTQTFFMKTLNEYPYVTELIEHREALELIKTTVQDNQPTPDHIEANRPAIAKRVTRTAHRRAASNLKTFDLKPSMLEALELMQTKYFTDSSLAIRPIIERNLCDSRHKKQFERLVRAIRREHREDGFVDAPTIREFHQLIDELTQLKSQDTLVEQVQDVLYYIKEN